MSYSSFAAFYDSLQSDVMYEQRAGYIAKLFKNMTVCPHSCLTLHAEQAVFLCNSQRWACR